MAGTPPLPPKAKDLDKVKKMLNKPAAASVKLTTAAILREDAIYKKKQEEEVALLKKYEAELHDASEFEKWKEEMETKEDEERKIAIEKRKIEMMLTDERARQARVQQEQENLELVRKLKEEQAVKKDELNKELEKEKEQKREKAKQIQENSKESVDKARQKLADTITEKADVVRNEKKEIEMRVAEMFELERQRKEELILQIKALHNVKPERGPVFDPTEVAGHGVLSEMSYAELQKRLDDMRDKQKRWEEEKRYEIIAAKKQKEDEIVERAKKISEFRQQAKKEKAKQKIQQLLDKKKDQEREKVERDQQLIELQQKLDAARDKRIAEKKRLQEEQLQREMFLSNADTAVYERNRYGDLEKGAEREIKQREDEKKKEKASSETIKAIEAKIRTNNTRSKLLAKEEYVKKSDTLSTVKKAEKDKEEETLVKRKQEVSRMRHEYEKTLRENSTMTRSMQKAGASTTQNVIASELQKIQSQYQAA